jgi:hypothetical protein
MPGTLVERIRVFKLMKSTTLPKPGSSNPRFYPENASRGKRRLHCAAPGRRPSAVRRALAITMQCTKMATSMKKYSTAALYLRKM